jgi:pimeloyl-ACP methyl ester carboxylesterase
MVLGPPPPFLGALDAMADPATTRAVVGQLLDMWSDGLTLPELRAYLDSMAASPDGLWQHAARAIRSAFAANPEPLSTIGKLDGTPDTLHLYAQPPDRELLDSQRSFASANPWFRVTKLEANSHFPMFEVPDEISDTISAFVTE